jgi:hypothetical protein
MMEERMKDMIHETLKSGGGITQAKGYDHDLIVTLMSSKESLGNVFLFHVYIVVAITKIKFGKVMSTTQLIQNAINVKNGKFVFDCDFIEGVKIRKHVLSALFLEYHDYKRITRADTRKKNTCF